MRKIIPILTYLVFISGFSFAQNADEYQKETMLEFLRSSPLKTREYTLSEYNKHDEQTSQISGYSKDSWHFYEHDNSLFLYSKNDGETMESHRIEEYSLSEDGVLYFETEDSNMIFWFHDDHILVEANNEEHELNKFTPSKSLTRFYFNM